MIYRKLELLRHCDQSLNKKYFVSFFSFLQTLLLVVVAAAVVVVQNVLFVHMNIQLLFCFDCKLIKSDANLKFHHLLDICLHLGRGSSSTRITFFLRIPSTTLLIKMILISFQYISSSLFTRFNLAIFQTIIMFTILCFI